MHNFEAMKLAVEHRLGRDGFDWDELQFLMARSQAKEGQLLPSSKNREAQELLAKIEAGSFFNPDGRFSPAGDHMLPPHESIDLSEGEIYSHPLSFALAGTTAGAVVGQVLAWVTGNPEYPLYGAAAGSYMGFGVSYLAGILSINEVSSAGR